MTGLLGRTLLLLNVGCVFVVGCGSSGPAAHDAGDGGRAGDGGSLDADAPAGDAPVDERGNDAGPMLDAASESVPDAARSDAATSDAATADTASDALIDADGGSDAVSRSSACGRSWSYDWSTPQSVRTWQVRRGAPVIDTGADELLLPFGSQEYQYIVSDSQYVMEFDLTIDGDLTFLAHESGGDDPIYKDVIPSITRSGSELVLASVTAGATSTAPGGGFTGQRFPAERVHVTLFVDPYGHYIGMKVDSSHGSFWSGFSNVNFVPHDLLLVGANLAAEQGTTARVHVGPLSACNRAFTVPCPPSSKIGFCTVAGVDMPPL